MHQCSALHPWLSYVCLTVSVSCRSSVGDADRHGWCPCTQLQVGCPLRAVLVICCCSLSRCGQQQSLSCLGTLSWCPLWCRCQLLCSAPARPARPPVCGVRDLLFLVHCIQLVLALSECCGSDATAIRLGTRVDCTHAV